MDNTRCTPADPDLAPASRAGRVNRQAEQVLRGEPGAALALAEEALRLARSDHDARGEATALRHAANALTLLGDYGPALSRWREALPAARVLGDALLVGSGLNGIGICLMRLGQFEGALQHFREFLAMDPAQVGERARTIALSNISSVCEETGDLDEARHCARQAIDNAVEDPDSAATARMNLAVLLARVHRYREALPHYQVALQALRRRGDVALQAHLLANLGKTQYVVGQREAGLQTLRETIALADQHALQTQGCLARLHLGQLLAHGRQLDAAHTVLDEALRRAQQMAEPYYQRELHRALGALDVLRGRAAAALRHTRALRRLEALLFRNASAERLRALRMAMRLDDEQRNAARLGVRNRRLAGAVATLKAQRDALQRRVGAEITTRAAPAPVAGGVLSARETQVLALLAQGLTNAAIGRTLGLSVYTARGYVSTVLQKLGAPSRAAAVARALHEGLLGPPQGGR